MTKKQIAVVLKKHGLWLKNEGGERANLSWAYLRWADLSGADLSGANLSWAYLSWANLSGADLSGADLSWAYLRWANLSGADLSGADLSWADLRWANLTGANLSGVYFSGADIPKVERLHAKIMEAINSGGKLEMHTWHTCETTHCRAGWAIQLSGVEGKRLENQVGSCAAGALIFAASYPDQRVPDFYANNKDAMADIERCAKEESENNIAK